MRPPHSTAVAKAFFLNQRRRATLTLAYFTEDNFGIIIQKAYIPISTNLKFEQTPSRPLVDSDFLKVEKIIMLVEEEQVFRRLSSKLKK